MLPNEGDDPMNGDQAGADGTDVGLKELSGGDQPDMQDDGSRMGRE